MPLFGTGGFPQTQAGRFRPHPTDEKTAKDYAHLGGFDFVQIEAATGQLLASGAPRGRRAP
jgi:hypothetical protein